MNALKFKDLLKSFEDDMGFYQAQWIPLGRPFSFDIYKSWIQDGSHAEMNYLKDHLSIKEKPQIRWPQARSALVFLAPYYPTSQNESFPLKETRVSLYAQGRDYHVWFRDKLQQVIEVLKESFPEEFFFAATDSVPILERDLGAQAGLGWIGKNNCLIHPKKGSFFFIGEILTSLEASVSKEVKLVHDFCGSCTRCVEICPTNAILPNRTLDAKKCIAYWTIESRDIAPEPLRKNIGDHFFGCDLCQTVCPWNQKVFKNQLETTLVRSLELHNRNNLIQEMKMILTSSGKALERLFAETPLSRAGSFGLKRNSLIVIANQNLIECEKEVRELHEHPKLGELAKWVTKELLKS